LVDLVAVYSRHARRWHEKRRGSLVERPLLERAAALSPPPGQVLDLGCGSGEPIARFFLERGYAVTGVDQAEPMLDVARQHLPAMTLRLADMRGLDLGQRFELVIAWDSSFHLGCADQRLMFQTFRAHTAPGGVLLFSSGREEGEGPGGDMFGDQLYHGSLDTAEYGALLERHGYEVVLHSAQDPAYGRTLWLARLRA
jgi:SAM-dependent methyltransferase